MLFLKGTHMNTNIDKSAVSAAVRDAFNFEVVKLPLTGADNHYTPWYGLFRQDSGAYIGSGSISERYVPHTADDVCALVEAAANAFDNEVDLECHFNNGHYVSVAPTADYRHSVYGTADNAFPRIVISAGFDKESFMATLGIFRDACLNLMLMRMIEGTSVSIRHTRSLRPKMDDLIASFSRLADGWTTITDVIDHLQSREVELAGFLDAVYGTPSPEDLQRHHAGEKVRSVTMHKNRTEAIMKRVMRERWQTGRGAMGAGFTVSAWEAFNAVQGYSQHDATRRKQNGVAVGQFDRVLLASKDSAVLAAEKLALAA